MTTSLACWLCDSIMHEDGRGFIICFHCDLPCIVKGCVSCRRATGRNQHAGSA